MKIFEKNAQIFVQKQKTVLLLYRNKEYRNR